MCPVSVSHWLLVVVFVFTVVYATENKTRHRQHSSKQLEHLYRSHNLVPGSTVGSWAAWSSWSQCTRTCGGGVSTQSRECVSHAADGNNSKLSRPNRVRRRISYGPTNSNSGACIGQYKRYQLCNTQPCSRSGGEDFRAQQCAKFNDKPFMDKFYQWVPFLRDANPCELNCRPKGERFFATLGSTVIDGTPCGPGRLAGKICVEGLCKKVGCDGIIGSDKTMDQCGVCGGDNSTCRIVSGLFTMPQLPFGYNLIASIPRGACNINITELKPSRNYLALRAKDGKYVINGDWDLNWSGSYEAAGTVFDYQRDDDGSATTKRVEAIAARGPTGDIIDMMVLSQFPNPGIKYEYTLPVNNNNNNGGLDFSNSAHLYLEDFPSRSVGTQPEPEKPPRHPKHQKHHKNHGNGGGSGGGHRRRNNRRQQENPVTAQSDYANVLPQSNSLVPVLSPSSSRGSRPSSSSSTYSWRFKDYSECSATCGGGIQKGIVVCVKNFTLAVVGDHNCDQATKPDSQTIHCNTSPCPPEWVLSSWSECSTTCGDGLQRREVTCKQQVSQTVQVNVAEGSCTGVKPGPLIQTCAKRPCYQWRTSNWGKCTARCGKGVRRREVTCVGPGEELIEENYCDSKIRPVMEEGCDSGLCSQNESNLNDWYYTEWSPCSESCGPGIQTRLIYCGASNALSCNYTAKPKTVQHCKGVHGCHGKWFTGTWNTCSSPCGPGIQKRDVVCMTNVHGQFKISSEVNCQDSIKPTTEQFCEIKKCGSNWYMSDWGQCSKTCDSGSQSRELKCLNEHQQPGECEEDDRPQTKQVCNMLPCLQGESQGDSQCIDKYHHCQLVVQSRLCKYTYYRDACCNSCRKFQ